MVNTFAHFTYYPGNSLRLQIFLHDPNLQLYNTRSYLGFYIFYQYFHLHYLQFHIPNSAMAWQHQSSLLTFGFTITLMHRPTLWHCLKLGYYNKHKYNLLCHPITRPRHGRLLTALSSTLYTTPTLCQPPTYPHRQHHHRRFSRGEQFHLSWKTSSCYEKQVGK